MLTQSQFQTLFPVANQDIFTELVNFIPQYNIDNLVMFLAQTAVESENLTVFTENLNYSSEALLRVWPSHFTQELANECAYNPEKIANIVYADRMGNDIFGDGWLYRGRGLIQITGKYNYTKFSKYLNKSLSETVLYMGTFPGIVESACWYWRYGNEDLNGYLLESDIYKVTRFINGGETDVEMRIQKFQTIHLCYGKLN